MVHKLAFGHEFLDLQSYVMISTPTTLKLFDAMFSEADLRENVKCA